MARLKVSQAADKLGLSKVSIHKWVKRLTLIEKGLAEKENGAVYLSDEALRVIEENHKAWAPETEKAASDEPVNPTENPREVNGNLYERLTGRISEEVGFLRQELTKRDETIRHLIEKQAEERQRTDSIIMKLAHDLEDTRRSALAIESKVNTLLPKYNEIDQELLNKPPKPVEVWTPPARKDPLESAGVLERVWAYFMEPERMRSQCAP